MNARGAAPMVLRRLFAYNLLFWFSRELARPAISISLADRIDSASAVGTLLAVQSLAPILLVLPFSRMGDRYGHARVIHLGSWLTAASSICFLAAELPGGAVAYAALLSAGQIVSGISWMIVWVALQALTSEKALETGGYAVSKAINRLVLFMSAGSLLGPLAAGQLIVRMDMQAVWLLYAGLAALQWVISRSLGRASARSKSAAEAAGDEAGEAAAPAGLRRDWSRFGGRAFTVVLAGTFVLMFGAELRGSYLPVHLRGWGLAADAIGTIVMCGALASALVRLLMNLPATERIPQRLVLYASLACSVAGIFSIAVLPGGYANVWTSVLLGLGGGLGEPVLIVLIVAHAAKSRRGTAMAMRILVNRLAMFLSPLSAGWSVQWLGARGGFLAVGTAMGLLGWLSVRKYHFITKRGVPDDHSTKDGADPL